MYSVPCMVAGNVVPGSDGRLYHCKCNIEEEGRESGNLRMNSCKFMND